MVKPNPYYLKTIQAFVESYFARNYRAPTVREIQKSAAISSTSLTKSYIDHLVKDGALVRVGDGSRGVVPSWVPNAIAQATPGPPSLVIDAHPSPA